MSGTLGKIAMVAGVVALAATGAGAVLGAGWGIAGIGSFSSIATAASLAGAAASVGASALAKTPPARGSVSSTTIGSDQPMPYLIGETYYGGSRIQQVGYGPTLDKVPNPYALIVDDYSGGGPVEGLVACYADFVPLGIPAGGGAATGYASGFLWAAVQRGAVPEASALTPRWAGAPGWGSDYRLSGHAAIAWSLLFDRKGKVFASGVPQLGAVWRGQKVWDPRRDDTWAGGQGGQRWARPADTAAHDAARATWMWSECPGLNALKYALGVFHRDPRVSGSTYQKVAGIGLPVTGVIVEDFLHLANVCDANGWKVGGVVFEPSIGSSSTRWQNLKDILAAGGAEPCFRGGRLGLKVSAPRIALDTISRADLADDDIVISSGLGWEDRLNTLIPKVRSRDHRWEYVASTKPVSIADQVAVDGEVKREERQFNLVQQMDQGAQLCAYELLDRRELGQIELVVKPRLRRYGPGDLLIVNLPDDGLDKQPCLILKRQPLPDRMAWRLILQSETPEKHAFALGRTAVPPPLPALRSTEELDGVAAPVDPSRAAYLIVRQSVAYPLDSTADAITIAAFEATIDDGRLLTFPAQELTGLSAGTTYLVLWDLSASTFVAVEAPALTETASSAYVIVRQMTTLNADGTTPSTPTPPAGDGGGGYGGGGCPVLDARILLANADRTGPGESIAAGEIKAGHWVWTKREDQLGGDAFGAYQVTMTRAFDSDLVAVPGRPVTSPSHLWWDGHGWVRSDVLGKPAGRGKVVALSVAQAATYQLLGADGALYLSHNKRAEQAAD